MTAARGDIRNSRPRVGYFYLFCLVFITVGVYLFWSLRSRNSSLEISMEKVRSLSVGCSRDRTRLYNMISTLEKAIDVKSERIKKLVAQLEESHQQLQDGPGKTAEMKLAESSIATLERDVTRLKEKLDKCTNNKDESDSAGKSLPLVIPNANKTQCETLVSKRMEEVEHWVKSFVDERTFIQFQTKFGSYTDKDKEGDSMHHHAVADESNKENTNSESKKASVAGSSATSDDNSGVEEDSKEETNSQVTKQIKRSRLKSSPTSQRRVVRRTLVKRLKVKRTQSQQSRR